MSSLKKQTIRTAILKHASYHVTPSQNYFEIFDTFNVSTVFM